MRLIDADKIMFRVAYDEDDKPFTAPLVEKADIIKQPTIEAVFETWLIKWAKEHNREELVKQILDDWHAYKATL